MDFPLREYEFEYGLFGKRLTAYVAGANSSEAADRLQAEFSGLVSEPVLRKVRLVSEDEYEARGEADGKDRV